MLVDVALVELGPIEDTPLGQRLVDVLYEAQESAESAREGAA